MIRKHRKHVFTIALITFILGSSVFIPQVVRSSPNATFSVNDNGDAADLNPGDGICDSSAVAGNQCTLRAAIQEVNALPGNDLITLGSISIIVGSPLPALTDEAGVTIRGNFASYIDGIVAGDNAVGLSLESDNNTIQGLGIINFKGYGIRVWWSENNLIGTDGDGVNDSIEKNHIVLNGQGGIFLMGGTNHVAGNYIGVGAAGTGILANGMGIYVEGALNCGTVIGTNGDGQGDTAEGNVISGSTGKGIYIHNSCVWVAGNKIGVNASGILAIPNNHGITVDELATGTLIGTNGDGISDEVERNIISGNNSNGIWVNSGAHTVTIAGNYIGVNANGLAAIPNQVGVYIEDSNNIIIGTNDDGNGDYVEGNLISGNQMAGVLLSGGESYENFIAGNLIGVNSIGDAAIGNQGGIELYDGTHHNIIGDDSDGQGDTAERNIISGNLQGVLIQGATTRNNIVAGNYIGVNYDGDTPIPNIQSGVYILNAPENTIGGEAGNIISGNTNEGIYIEGIDATSNIVAYNSIGLSAGGQEAIPNRYGIRIRAPGNLIGREGQTTIDGNIISGNQMSGIHLEGSWAHGNVIAGNYIGTNSYGEEGIPNYYGISILDAPANRIGTNGDGIGDAGERNLISGNSGSGIRIDNAGADGNIIAGNYIGVDTYGRNALKNGQGDWGEGIYISLAPNTLIGTNADGLADAAERNIISGNNVGGISVNGSTSAGTVIAGNYIGTDFTGIRAIPNGDSSWNGDQAISISNATVRIGTNGDGVHDVAERNIISGNYGWGIKVAGSSAETLIAGNYIGVDVTGIEALGNNKSGILLTETYNVSIGGIGPEMANIIAYNDGDGVTVGADPSSLLETDNLVRGNSIYANEGLGIDLGDDGVTANDAGDADNGPNKLQNYPVISSVTGNADSTNVTGTLNSQANQIYWLDFYANPTCDASGYGEGMFYLGTGTVNTNASGNASFTIELPVATVSGYKISATAMGSDKGSTSEFSKCVTSTSTYVPTIINIADATLVEPESGWQDMTFMVSLSSPATTTISVQYATLDGTAEAGSDYDLTAGTLTFKPGDVRKMIAVPIRGDREEEPNETFTVRLSNPFNVTIGKANATGTILDEVPRLYLPLVIR